MLLLCNIIDKQHVWHMTGIVGDDHSQLLQHVHSELNNSTNYRTFRFLFLFVIELCVFSQLEIMKSSFLKHDVSTTNKWRLLQVVQFTCSLWFLLDTPQTHTWKTFYPTCFALHQECAWKQCTQKLSNWIRPASDQTISRMVWLPSVNLLDFGCVHM